MPRRQPPETFRESEKSEPQDTPSADHTEAAHHAEAVRDIFEQKQGAGSLRFEHVRDKGGFSTIPRMVVEKLQQISRELDVARAMEQCDQLIAELTANAKEAAAVMVDEMVQHKDKKDGSHGWEPLFVGAYLWAIGDAQEMRTKLGRRQARAARRA